MFSELRKICQRFVNISPEILASFRECVSLIHMAARYRRDFMGDEAEDNVFRGKPYEFIITGKPLESL